MESKRSSMFAFSEYTLFKLLLQNFTGSKLRENTISDFYCSRELIREVNNHFIFLAVLNTLVFATAFLGNTLAIIALYKESSLNPASKIQDPVLCVVLCVLVLSFSL